MDRFDLFVDLLIMGWEDGFSALGCDTLRINDVIFKYFIVDKAALKAQVSLDG